MQREAKNAGVWDQDGTMPITWAARFYRPIFKVCISEQACDLVAWKIVTPRGTLTVSVDFVKDLSCQLDDVDC